MKLKKYIAPDMHHALRLVREAQGDDALIVSTRTTERGSEIIAAVDYDDAMLQQDAEEVALAENGFVATADPAVSEKVVDSETSMRELATLRMLMESVLAELSTVDEAPRPARGIAAQLVSAGFSEGFSREVVAHTSPSSDEAEAWAAASLYLRSRIPTIAQPLLREGGVVALVGPTGVGKTTTIAKIAARQLLEHGRDSVALITTDRQRIGAREQLQTIADLLQVPMHCAASGSELAGVLARERNRRLLLIDNTGLSQRDMGVAGQQANLCAIPLIRTYLTLSANADGRCTDEVIRSYGQTGTLSGCVLTKLDEALIGPALEAIIEHRLPLAWYCDGQRIPEDVHEADGDALVKYAMEFAAAS